MNYEQQIKKLAAEKNAVILAHNYQGILSILHL